MRVTAKPLVCLVGLLLLVSAARAGCWEDASVANCGLEFFVAVEDSVFAPRDCVVFTLKLSNCSNQPVYIPTRFFEYSVLPCTLLPSGKLEYHKAVFGAPPECDKLPAEGDIVLEVGESVEFEIFNYAHPELGVQKWSFKGLLYKCPEIQYSVNCEIESNVVELVVRSER